MTGKKHRLEAKLLQKKGKITCLVMKPIQRKGKKNRLEPRLLRRKGTITGLESKPIQKKGEKIVWKLNYLKRMSFFYKINVTELRDGITSLHGIYDKLNEIR